VEKLALREVRFDAGAAHAEWVGCWHAQLYILARQGRSFGEFSTTIRSFVASYGGHVPDESADSFPGWLKLCLELWEAFLDHGIVEVADELPSDAATRFRVRVVAFGETNTPRAQQRTATDGNGGRSARPMTSTERGWKLAENQRRRSAGCPEMSHDEWETYRAQRHATDGNGRQRTATDGRLEQSRAEETDKGQETAAHDDAALDLPPHPRTVGGQIRKAQGQLGYLAVHVRECIGRRSNGDLPQTRELADYWRPACALLADHGADRLGKAFGVAAQEAASSMKFVQKVCERMQRDDERGAKPRLAVVRGAAMSDEDAAALDAVDGGEHVGS
jgi:hypothetical protein